MDVDFLRNQIFSATEANFEKLCLKVFAYQFEKNPIYSQYCKLLRRTPSLVSSMEEIPFLPIEFFKTGNVVSFEGDEELLFESSATTSSQVSKHKVKSVSLYQESFLKCFNQFYGEVDSYSIFGLLPSYLERANSSLIYMVDQLIQLSNDPLSGFYLNEYEELLSKINQARSQGKKVLLIGVSFALLDLAEKYPSDLSNVIIMETGGMKGRHKEITRKDLHTRLRSAFNVNSIHSEYGMTELLSQAYSDGNGLFSAPPWMRMKIRDSYDPLSFVANGKQGGINVIDLANLYSCSFIETSDIGINHENGFEVLGRQDHADIRGCNLMVSSVG